MKKQYMQKDISMTDNITDEEGEVRVLTEDDLRYAIPAKEFLDAKKQICIRLRAKTLFYFQLLAKEKGIPYQTLINMYLDDCAKKKRELKIDWE